MAAELIAVSRNIPCFNYINYAKSSASIWLLSTHFLRTRLGWLRSIWAAFEKATEEEVLDVTVAIFGPLERDDWVYTVMIENTKLQTLLEIIRDRIQPDCIFYTDSFRS